MCILTRMHVLPSAACFPLACMLTNLPSSLHTHPKACMPTHFVLACMGSPLYSRLHAIKTYLFFLFVSLPAWLWLSPLIFPIPWGHYQACQAVSHVISLTSPLFLFTLPNQIQPNQTPCQANPNTVKPNQLNQIQHKQIKPSQIKPIQIPPSQFQPLQIPSNQIQPNQIQLTKYRQNKFTKSGQLRSFPFQYLRIEKLYTVIFGIVANDYQRKVTFICIFFQLFSSSSD